MQWWWLFEERDREVVGSGGGVYNGSIKKSRKTYSEQGKLGSIVGGGLVIVDILRNYSE